MNTATKQLDSFLNREYEAGFVTDIESHSLPKGLSEDIIRQISAIKKEPEFLLEWRLAAYEIWKKMTPPTWAHVDFPPVDFQDI
ncbi:MAG TPA: Fe-S cluster assembly protein SufB, partial [Burkholderiaceae bacterium]|nr:Fe-S cluster assembly protein SufB [Burkholderiaceae bacterium]